MASISGELVTFIAEETGMSAEEFGLDTKLFSEGYIDSFAMTSIIAFIEETFDISISQSDVTLENLDTIENMVAFIQGSLGQ